MRLSSMILFASVGALLLAESQPGAPGQRIEVRTTNSLVEIAGSDSDRVQVNDSSHATVNNSDGGVVVEGDGAGGNAPLKLQVPRRSTLDVFTANGAIHVSGVAGAMRLRTSNGAIIVQNAGAAEIHAHTSNGSIELAVPGGLNANLSARTSNGRIHVDMEVVAHRIGANFLEGKIGSGGPEIDLQTSNGSIYLRSDSQQESVSSTFRPGEVK
jgi:DUF4097 and DUF4098 domain-containing protein YvlB